MVLGGASAMRGNMLTMNKCKSILLCLLAMLLLSACTAPAKQVSGSTAQAAGNVTAAANTTVRPTEPTTVKAASEAKTKTVKIKGVLYRNNFQGNLIYMDPQYGSRPVLEKGLNRYFRMDCKQYDLLCNVNVRDFGNGESIYCRDSQWQKLHAYYANPKNFKYECARRELGAAGLVFYPVPNMNTAKLDALVAFFDRNFYNPFGSHSGVKTRRVPYSVSNQPELRFIKTSKDMLFSEGAAQLFIWKGKLVLEWYTFSNIYMKVVDVPDKLGKYFIGIVNALEPV
jgi:hypothetical protein